MTSFSVLALVLSFLLPFSPVVCSPPSPPTREEEEISYLGISTPTRAAVEEEEEEEEAEAKKSGLINQTSPEFQHSRIVTCVKNFEVGCV